MTRKLSLIFLLLFCGNAVAASVDDVTVLTTITAAMKPAANTLLTQSIKWLAAFASIQFVITNFGLIKKGASIEEAFGKLIGSFAWIGFCGYVLDNGPAWLASVGQQFFSVIGLNLPSPGSIIGVTVGLVASLAAIASGVGFFNTTVGTLLVYILLILLGVGLFFAAKIFMVQLELGLVVMLSPLSFSFLGLNALKDQGIAPFKALISLGYRIILMTVILSAFTEVGNVVSSTLTGASSESILAAGVATFANTILAALGAYLLLAYALFKSDSIASALASGTTNMGTADVAAAAAMGAAAGAAVASGGASVAGGAANVGQSMGDFMKGLTGGDGGSLTNASSRGAGPAPVGAPPLKANMSVSGGGSSAFDKAPARSTSMNATGSASGATRSPSSSNANTTMPADRNSPIGSAPTSSAEADAPLSSAGTGATGNASPDADATNIVAAPTMDASGGPTSNFPAAPGAREKAPERPSYANTGNDLPPARTSGGSGATAAIGAPPSSLEQQVGDLVQALSQPKEKKGTKDHLSELNQHVAREQASTHISINTHHSD